MNLRSGSLLGAAVTVGATPAALTPNVPWWGQLIMALVSAALAYFGGLAAQPRTDGR